MFLDVQVQFDNALKRQLAQQPDILRFVLKHERKQKCINELCAQISLIERQAAYLNFGKKFFGELISNVAKMFALNALTAKEQEIMATSEKQRLLDKAHADKAIEDEFNDLNKDLNEDKIQVFT